MLKQSSLEILWRGRKALGASSEVRWSPHRWDEAAERRPAGTALRDLLS